ncbi:DUF6642 family protein [Lysobacter soli]|uniref:DUF6642 family protein n=1 Tax=Lysobacter soli TaxID=453783 RepID=UPI00240F89CB|nr:DUF6642 family protein [Lysobacter soli]MDG2518094.1 hypothetical protein [Lysobacter soli]
MEKGHGVFCIEGEWERDLRDQSSIRPLVEFLANSDNQVAPIYRRAATIDTFSYFVSQWKDYPAHTIGYFSFHGEKGSLSLGRDRLDLSSLGALLKGACKNKHIVLSSCQTLNVPGEQLAAFRRQTGARSVSGYRKSPDWIEASAFDVILMTNLLYHDSPSRTEAWLLKRCAGLMDAYGFVIDYRSRVRS